MSNPKGTRILMKFVMFFISAVFITGIGVASYGYFITQRINKGSTGAKTKKVETGSPVNILLLGVDAGSYEDKSDNNHKRSDTIMVFNYNPQNDKVHILSIPRDTKIKINGHTEKINAAHAIGGPEAAIKTIENLLGIDINYYAKIDYEGFRECVDAIGGIDVTISHDMNYDAQDIHIHFKKGETVHLDGENAERFVRWRKNNDGNGYAMGDLGRISTQQEFIVKIVEKLKTPAGMIRILPLMSTVSQYVETNMDSKTMLAYALKLKNISSSDIEKRILEGEPKYIAGVSYFIYDENKNKEYLSKFKNSLYHADGNENTDRGQIKVIILNSTGINGLASKYKDKMEEMGYNVVEVGNYTKKVNSTIINDYTNNNYGNIIYQDIKCGTVVKKQGKNAKANIVVILGKDIVQ